VFEKNNLLQRGVGGKCLRSEVGRDPTAHVLVFFAQHVMKITLTKELLSKWVARELKSIGLNIGENLMGEFCVSNEDYELPNM
jgi:hypothetical protein